MSEITLSTLTEGTIGGNGVFDKLMAATKEHLEQQFNTGAIKGAEYAQVYLGSIQQVLQTAVAFVSTQQKLNLETQLLEQQVILAQVQVQKANAEVELMAQQILNAKQEVELSKQQVIKIQEEIKLLPKQLLQIQAQTDLINQQKLNAVSEQNKIDAEVLNIPKQGVVLTNQATLIAQQKLNAEQENKNLIAQECLLKAQFDNTQQTTLSVAAQTTLYTQKVVTEKAQTLEIGVDENSVIGRQKMLYKKQSDGFDRDAEQKILAQMIQTWNTRRMTDEGVSANTDNKLDDATIGRVVNKALTGIQA